MISGLVIWLVVEEPVRGAAEPELEGLITEEKASRYKMKTKDMIKIPWIFKGKIAIPMGRHAAIFDHLDGRDPGGE